MYGRQIAFTQTPGRVVLHGLPEAAPNALDTVIELKYEGRPYMILGSGYELIENDPYPTTVW